MYKFIYAHHVHTKQTYVETITYIQERERKERGERKKEKKTFSSYKHPSTGPSLHHRKFETEICLFMLLIISKSHKMFFSPLRAYLLLSNTTEYIFLPNSSYTHTRVYSRKNHPHRAHLNSHAQTHIPLFSSHTQNTPQSKKDVLLYHFHRRENRPKIRPPKAIG